ncbi:MAG: prolyl oligopeptidase family serine peptidase [Alphaproteobacteria bacterium]|nr:prolyl oligopeptidase family serine peptidase [Alphaproteobacteria bacterium]
MTQELDGPRVGPLSGAARQLIVLVHGYGADGADLIGLAPHWARMLPDAAFVAPNGPQVCDMNPAGYQWFPISRLDPREIATGAQLAAPALSRFIDAELAALGLGGADLALVGFSQGTILSLQVGLRRRPAPAAILGYSGALAAPDRLAGEITARPPVLLIHGEADPVVPVGALHQAVAALGANGVPVQFHTAPGLGHGIDAEGMAMGAAFLAAAFGDGSSVS